MSVEEVYAPMAESLKRVLSFKRDDRFDVVLGEFSTDDSVKVRAILDTYYRDVWDSENIESAPAEVQQIVSTFGGITPGQLLLSTNLGEHGQLFCAWWPWGNGKTISIRIGVKNGALDTEEAQKQFFRLMTGFFS